MTVTGTCERPAIRVGERADNVPYVRFVKIQTSSDDFAGEEVSSPVAPPSRDMMKAWTDIISDDDPAIVAGMERLRLLREQKAGVPTLNVTDLF